MIGKVFKGSLRRGSCQPQGWLGPPTPHGRGGSVSRRDLNHPAGNRTQLSWARTSEGKDKPIPSYSSGERGLGGEALLLEKRPLPPAFPPPHVF